MEHQLYVYHDRSHLSTLPTKIKHELSKHSLLFDKDNSVMFCGMVVDDGAAHVFFPRNTIVSKDDHKLLVSKASQLLQAIYRYSLISNSTKTANDEGSELVGDSQLGLIIELLSDYQRNGLYTHKYAVNVKNIGKPDWNKTISKSIAFMSARGPVYFDIYGKKQNYNQDNEITLIHASVLSFLFERFGWLISDTSTSLTKLRTVGKSHLSKKNQISLIKNEMNNIYSDHDIRLLSNLKRYISSEIGRDSSVEVMGIRSFHVMWEHMLSKVLDNVIEVNNLLPTPAYKILNRDGRVVIINAKRNGQRTDIVVKRPEHEDYCVIDAKYYGAHSIESVPKWGDLVKQFFYVTALKTIVPVHAVVSNAFIFPGNRGPIRSIHMCEQSDGTLIDDVYPPITCYYICPHDVISTYLKSQKLKNQPYWYSQVTLTTS
ncbi:LlaJI family restriction endonuclease [Shewanella aestuarii]|uniref:LlaJI family restriction endonuclease n=3 Tax=Shewanella aestuarii TaxID=1028752 RepID=A0ABT0L663_9GAMM|nr:LlaJI family restriction endonuclease [Shewanella aestuarii]MCL1118910.1 LlaJI family restriction endonuclease [Shewanella aestuarii]